VLTSTGSGTDWKSLSEITGVDGTGTANYVTKWSDADTITNSIIYDNGTNVGIGTTTPDYKLNIVDNQASDYVGLFIANSRPYGTGQGAYGSSLWLGKEENGGNQPMGAITARPNSEGNSTEGHMTFSTRASSVLNERMRITNTGNIGIGTTSPDSVLQVLGGVKIGGAAANQYSLRFQRENLSIPQDSHFYSPSNNSPSAFFIEGGYYTSEASGVVTAANSGYAYYERYFGNGSAGTFKHLGFVNVANGAFTSTALVPSIVMLSTGNVGIGTVSPSEKLHVVGNVKVEGSIGVTNIVTNYVVKFNGSILDDSIIYDNGTNIGIGTTSPASKLDVFGEGRFNVSAAGNTTTAALTLVNTTDDVNNGVRIGWKPYNASFETAYITTIR
jgi:hypothetical protein